MKGLTAASTIAVLLLAASATGCGGGDDQADAPAEAPSPASVRANLEGGGYEVGEDVTNGANMALPPDGKINADVYFHVESGPEQEPGLTAGVYFFSDAADAKTVAGAFDDSPNEVRDTRLYNIAGDDQAALDALVATGEGE